MVAAGGLVWVSGVAPGAVAYDARTGEVVHRAPFNSEVVQAMATDGRTVYAVGVGPEVLLRIDAGSGRVLAVPLDGEPLPESAVAVAGDRAWVLVDPAAPRLVVVEDARLVGSLPAPEGALAVRYGVGSLWVTAAGELLRLDPSTGAVTATYAVGSGARFLTVGADAVWTLDAADGTVSGVDPESGEVRSVLVSDQFIDGGDIAAGLGAVWARTATGVTRVDPETATATHRVEVEPGSGSVAAAAGWLWLSDHDHLAVHRVPVTALGG